MKELTPNRAVEALQVVRRYQRGLVREASDRLRSFILDGRARSEDVLPSEPRLTAMMGVSRTVLREALRHLEAQGLVVVAHGKRSRVRAADPEAAVRSLEAYLLRMPDAMERLLEVRVPLECEMAALAARRATPERVEALRKAVRDLGRARSLELRIEADLRFHRILAELSRNPVFTLLLDSMGLLLRESRQRTLGRHGSGGALRAHREILRAVERRRPAEARAAMVRHFRVTRRELEAEGR